MTDIVANAMAGVTAVMGFVMEHAELAAIALGYPFIRAATRVFKRIVRI